MSISAASLLTKSLVPQLPKEVKAALKSVESEQAVPNESSGNSQAINLRSVTIPYLKKDTFGQPVEEEAYKLEDVLSSSDLAHIQELESRQNMNPPVHFSPDQIDSFAKQYYEATRPPAYAPVPEKKYSLIMGLPASGKSTLIQRLQKETPSVPFLIDSIRPMLPGFKHGDGSRSLMDAARQIGKQVFEKALANRESIIHEETGRDIPTLKSWLEEVKRNGYKTCLFLVDIPNKEAIKRVVSRSKVKDPTGNHKFSRPSDVMRIGNQDRLVFESLAQTSDLVDEYTVFDNFKEPMKLVDHHKKEIQRISP